MHFPLLLGWRRRGPARHGSDAPVFCAAFNGAGYKKYRYDDKLVAAYAKFMDEK